MERKTYTTEEIEKKFASLPEEIKTLLYSPEMLNTIKGIGEKYRLHVDQVGLLEAETSEVMLGLIEAKDYPRALAESLDIDSKKADIIAKDINDQLFVKIRESMKKVYEETKTAPPVVSSPTQTKLSTPPASPVPPAQPTTPSPASVPTPPPTLVAKPPEVRPADTMLTEKTVSTPKPPPAPPKAGPPPAEKPPPYKADPYREPPE